MYKITHPHPSNVCGGNYSDWIEVNLTDKCNGKCSWCVEKQGWHPKKHVGWKELVNVILSTGKKNVILLGGEPTLYPFLNEIITELHRNKRKVWITTNGSNLKKLINIHYFLLSGINISIHHYDLNKNFEITGIHVSEEDIRFAVGLAKLSNTKLRLNCNTIKGYIDSKTAIKKYITFAKKLGVRYIRFAELKGDNEHFVNIPKIFDYGFGLTENPFEFGCSKDAIINGVNINFRIMCGIQTSMRPAPVNPIQTSKITVYYDGKIYDGWQMKDSKKKEKDPLEPTTDINEIVKILKKVKKNKIDVNDAIPLLNLNREDHVEIHSILTRLSQGELSTHEAIVHIDRLKIRPTKIIKETVSDGSHCHY